MAGSVVPSASRIVLSMVLSAAAAGAVGLLRRGRPMVVAAGAGLGMPVALAAAVPVFMTVVVSAAAALVAMLMSAATALVLLVHHHTLPFFVLISWKPHAQLLHKMNHRKQADCLFKPHLKGCAKVEYLLLIPLTFLLGGLLLLLFVRPCPSAQQAGYVLLTPHQAAYRLLCCERILLLDVRDAEETEEFSLPRARNVPLCMLAERIASLAPDRSLPIFLCCDSGSRSRAATLLLLELGYHAACDVGEIRALAEALERLGPDCPFAQTGRQDG